jgi:hypothetical protein
MFVADLNFPSKVTETINKHSRDENCGRHGYGASLLATTLWVPDTHSIAAGGSE